MRVGESSIVWIKDFPSCVASSETSEASINMRNVRRIRQEILFPKKRIECLRMWKYWKNFSNENKFLRNVGIFHCIHFKLSSDKMERFCNWARTSDF
jgi:hypothetical protein